MSRGIEAATPRGDARALRLACLLTLFLAGFLLLPRVHASTQLTDAFVTAVLCLATPLFLLWRQVARTDRVLRYEVALRPAHWVQMIMHSCVYAYWGWYWREVYRELPLIAAQVIFLYIVDMLVCWWRRDTWTLGFGPFPIVLSTNLFLWFRDEWFYLQFVMIALIVFGKEFLKWKRDGHRVHIFNPSALALFVVSIALLATGTSQITWAEQISATFHRPPSIYLEIFLLGLVVQALFSVTLVTLTAAAMLGILNIAYTSHTGLYQFIDTNIPPAVFLGLHLLVTDPATSPRRNFGKIVFGAGYGAGVFVAYGLLAQLGAPTFYDKLLCVPVLNLTVRALDRASVVAGAWFARLKVQPVRMPGWNAQQMNFACMGVWVAVFGVMTVTGFLGGKQPGSDPAFWERACQSGRKEACRIFAHTLDVQCQDNLARGCYQLGMLLSDGKELPRDATGAARSFGHACEIGYPYGCVSLTELVKSDGDTVLSAPCERGDATSCFLLGTLYVHGQGVARNTAKAAALFERSCDSGLARGCGFWGESYLFGQGVTADMAKAKDILEKACTGGYGPGCFNAGLMYRLGTAVQKNETLALARFQRGCNLGFRVACRALKESSQTDAPSHRQ